MKRVFGIETEYGITIQGAESVDVVAESIELVRSYTEHGAHMKWDYGLEDPHRDARGFRAAELLQDTDESAYYEIDKNRPLSFEEIKSDLVLSNGARFYNDHAHPEYSTPECTTLRQLVAHEKAGERILAECARRRNLKLPADQEVRLYKNNTDFVGHSYGCHDNYLMRRDVPWDRLVAGVLPFLITRQIFAGAGKMGIEAESAAGQPGVFQISQRADFFSVLVSIDTMNKRPLVNTRDEPHADASLYRRFHVIIGDSNMSEWATALKVGTTALVLDLIERGEAPQIEIAQPIDATKSISRDQNYDWIIELSDGRKISAIDVQRLYLKAARKVRERRCGNDLAAAGMGDGAERSRARCGADPRPRRLGGEEVFAQRVSRRGEAFLDRSVAPGDRPRISQHPPGPGLVLRAAAAGFDAEHRERGGNQERDLHAAGNDARLFSRPVGGEIQRRDHVDSMG